MFSLILMGGLVLNSAANNSRIAISGSLDGSPQSLDPANISDNSQWNTLPQLSLNLVKKRQGVLMPEGASRWTQSRDHTRFEFFLRSDIRSSDGQPVNATTWKFSLARLMSQPGPTKALLLPYLHLDDIKTPAHDHLIIQLRKPYSGFLERLSSPEFILVTSSSIGPDGKPNWTISTGPYKLDQPNPHDDGSRVLVANPVSIRFRPQQAAKIILYPRPQTKQELFHKLKTGEWQFSYGEIVATEPNRVELANILAKGKFNTLRTAYNGGIFFVLRETPALRDAGVRLTIFRHLWNRLQLTDKNQESIPAGQLFPPGFPGHIPPSPLEEIWAKINQRKKISLPKTLVAYYPTSAKLFGYATWFQTALAEIGISVTLKETTYADYNSIRHSAPHDVFLFKTAMNLSDPIGSLLGLLGRNGLFTDPSEVLLQTLLESKRAKDKKSEIALQNLSKKMIQGLWVLPALHTQTAFNYSPNLVFDHTGPIDPEIALESIRVNGDPPAL